MLIIMKVITLFCETFESLLNQGDYMLKVIVFAFLFHNNYMLTNWACCGIHDSQILMKVNLVSKRKIQCYNNLYRKNLYFLVQLIDHVCGCAAIGDLWSIRWIHVRWKTMNKCISVWIIQVIDFFTNCSVKDAMWICGNTYTSSLV